jgi:hypothetical protein
MLSLHVKWLFGVFGLEEAQGIVLDPNHRGLRRLQGGFMRAEVRIEASVSSRPSQTKNTESRLLAFGEIPLYTLVAVDAGGFAPLLKRLEHSIALHQELAFTGSDRCHWIEAPCF